MYTVQWYIVTLSIEYLLGTVMLFPNNSFRMVYVFIGGTSTITIGVQPQDGEILVSSWLSIHSTSEYITGYKLTLTAFPLANLLAVKHFFFLYFCSCSGVKWKEGKGKIV